MALFLLPSRAKTIFFTATHARFWQILSVIFNEKIQKNNYQKIAFLLNKKIALWDVIKECEISGANDSSITNVIPNNLEIIFNTANIKTVFTTGAVATKLYKNFFHQNSIYLPSPSPANFSCDFNTLVEKYRVILEYLK